MEQTGSRPALPLRTSLVKRAAQHEAGRDGQNAGIAIYVSKERLSAPKNAPRI